MDRPTRSPGLDLVSFAHPVLINLLDRPDRLRDSMVELEAAAGRSLVPGDDVHLVRPVRFADAAGFARPGFRSNLDAHLRAARWARSKGLDRVLVLEDDLAISPAWARAGQALLAQLLERPWDLASLGYLDTWGEAPAPAADPRWVRFTGKVNGAHAYLVNGPAFDDWIEHLEMVSTGRPGDDLLGPMPSDGAINTFAWVDPSRIRLLATPNLAGTRPTRSDITPGLLDRLPVLGAVAESARRWRHRRSGWRAVNS